MTKFLKRLVSYYFGKGPKVVSSFRKILVRKKTTFIDVPETFTAILKHEVGPVSYYKAFNNKFKANFTWRKIDGKPRYKDGGLFKTNDRTLYSLENGLIFSNIGIIYDSETRIAVEEAAMEWFEPLKKKPFFSAIRFTPPKKMTGIALSIASVGADGGFYHFLHEAFPKLDFCRDQLSVIDYFLIPGEKTVWKSKLLTAAGIDSNKLIWLTNTAHYQFDQLLFTNRIMHDQQFSSVNLTGIKRLLNFERHQAPKHIAQVIWISRSDADKRNLTWENLIISRYPQIKVIEFAHLSVQETIAICSSSSFVIGPHGAGFSNLIFCSPETKVLEIFPDEHFYPLYHRLSESCGLTHTAIRLDFQNPQNEFGFKYLENILLQLFSNQKNDNN